MNNLYIFLFFFLLFFKFSTKCINAVILIKLKILEISEPYDINFNKEKVINKAFEKAFEILISKLQPQKIIKNLKNS